jgi:SAM-dependent methyltransferase
MTQQTCIACAGRLQPLYDRIEDFEYAVAHNSTLVMCSQCGLVTQSPRVEASEIPGLYPNDYQAYNAAKGGIFGRLKALLIRREARRILAHASGPAPRIIEIGCGNGSLLRAVGTLHPGTELAGVDIKDLGVSEGGRVRFYCGQVEEVALPRDHYDVVFCSNLIEHVSDPMRFLAKIREILKPGGTLMLITPDHLSVDRHVFGRRWGGYHYPRHTFVFNHTNIATILRKAGFDVAKLSGSYSFWGVSVQNVLHKESGRKPRGLLFFMVTALFLPLDLLINRFRPHGSMTIVARKSA